MKKSEMILSQKMKVSTPRCQVAQAKVNCENV